MSEPLKPCPFCGSTPTLPEGYASVVLLCPKCGECGPESAHVVDAWNTRHDPIALDFGTECTDGMSRAADVEQDRNRRAWKVLRLLVRAMRYEEVPRFAKGPWCKARDLMREVDAPDDGAEARRPKVLLIERGGSGL